MESLFQNIMNALQWGSFYSLIALGYCLVYGVLRLINFAHGDIFMVGAFIAYFAATFLMGMYTDFSFGLPNHVVLLLTIPITMILTAGVGVTIERVAYRPLRNKGAHRLYVVITALMCGLILQHANLAVLGASRRSFPDLVERTVYTVGGVTFTNLRVMTILTAFLVFAGLYAIISKTRIGMAMRAISYDRFAIPLMGIPVTTIVVITFVMGSSLAGLAGLLYSMSYPVLEPYMGAMIGWKAFIAAVVGGIGDIRGAFVGGFLLGFLEIMVVAFFPSTFRDLIAFSILLLILSLKPTGIFGTAITTKI
ncbi:amino acid/amide ABC transporter membrane protein 1, HAAT family [Desulfonatronum thiosulfatophilum]|uniref:Amino acid/amide ABC transporter membrane protein 1, HAAT family n=1 Tax=Desulfonatronum thiosulfatophilum TaxID=617002 RepID=A0A1G6E1D8_9BACT|nr:branched-chain amino acid ABC transporter permease [Desulfonatronum thiosulfatophilum]SDB51201.1 amino acid/amide ABC transporter membrane protein 1, HAAT family [Desulfonatronum thiosulfatophilum]